MSQRFFFDANLIGVARVMEQTHDRIVYPGHSDWPLNQEEGDDVWLPLVGDRGWCAIFRDQRIRYRRTERAALERHRVRSVVIATRQNLTIAENVDLLEEYWSGVEETFASEPALYHLTSAGVREKLKYVRTVPPSLEH